MHIFLIYRPVFERVTELWNFLNYPVNNFENRFIDVFILVFSRFRHTYRVFGQNFIYQKFFQIYYTHYLNEWSSNIIKISIFDHPWAEYWTCKFSWLYVLFHKTCSFYNWKSKILHKSHITWLSIINVVRKIWFSTHKCIVPLFLNS